MSQGPVLRTSATARVWWIHPVAKVRPNGVSLDTSLNPSDALVDEVIQSPKAKEGDERRAASANLSLVSGLPWPVPGHN